MVLRYAMSSEISEIFTPPFFKKSTEPMATDEVLIDNSVLMLGHCLLPSFHQHGKTISTTISFLYMCEHSTAAVYRVHENLIGSGFPMS